MLFPLVFLCIFEGGAEFCPSIKILSIMRKIAPSELEYRYL